MSRSADERTAEDGIGVDIFDAFLSAETTFLTY